MATGNLSFEIDEFSSKTISKNSKNFPKNPQLA
jgi:hypothetical protein